MKDIHFFSIFISFILIKYPRKQDAKKIIFTACHSGMLKLAFTRPGVISTSPKTFLTGRIDFTVLLIRIPQKGSAFTSLIAKSTSPGLLDTTFFARCSKVSSGKPFTCGRLQYLVLTEQDINSYKTSILIYYMKETWKYALNLACEPP